MGTRALISIEGKPMIATHWDGNPPSLGLDLLNCDRSIEGIIDVAKKHTIDFADDSIIENLDKERIEYLSKKHNLSKDKIREGFLRGNVISAEDHRIHNISDYGDWADFQYNIQGNQIFFRPLSGSYPNSLEGAVDFELLTQERYG